MKKHYKLATILLLLITVVFITACGNEETAVKVDVVKVNSITIEKSSVPYTIDYPGTVEGENKVKLSTKLMGKITYFPFEPGTKVNKGQVLAKINSGDIDAKQQQIKSNILQAEAAFGNVEINYKRVKSLFDKNSATKKEMEDIQLAYDIAKAQLNSVKEMKNEIENVLSYSEIRAPFDGYIVNKFFEEGDITAPGHPLMIVESFNDFNVTAMVSASDISLFNVGQKVSLTIDAVSKNVLNGKIIEVNPGGNSYSKQFEIKASVENLNGNNINIKSGMFASISLNGETKTIVTIDENLLVKRGQLVGVYSITKNNESILRWVRLGRKINGKYEVLSGLTDGDIIIIDKEKVKEGQRVEVI